MLTCLLGLKGVLARNWFFGVWIWDLWYWDYWHDLRFSDELYNPCQAEFKKNIKRPSFSNFWLEIFYQGLILKDRSLMEKIISQADTGFFILISVIWQTEISIYFDNIFQTLFNQLHFILVLGILKKEKKNLLYKMLKRNHKRSPKTFYSIELPTCQPQKVLSTWIHKDLEMNFVEMTEAISFLDDCCVRLLFYCFDMLSGWSLSDLVNFFVCVGNVL